MAEKVEGFVKAGLKLWREVKVYTAREGLKLVQAVEAALKRYLELEAEAGK